MLRHGGGVEGRDLRSLGNLIRVGARVLRPVVLVGEEVPRLRLISRQRGHDELRCHDGGGSRYWNSDERSKGDGRFKSWFMLPRGHEREGTRGARDEVAVLVATIYVRQDQKRSVVSGSVVRSGSSGGLVVFSGQCLLQKARGGNRVELSVCAACW